DATFGRDLHAAVEEIGGGPAAAEIHEDSGHGNDLCLTLVHHLDAGDGPVAHDPLDLGPLQQFDLRVPGHLSPHLLIQPLTRKEVDPAGDADDQLQFGGHLAAVADDRHVFPVKKCGVTRGTVTYAPTDELFFSRDRPAAAKSSGGDDDRA